MQSNTIIKSKPTPLLWWSHFQRLISGPLSSGLRAFVYPNQRKHVPTKTLATSSRNTVVIASARFGQIEWFSSNYDLFWIVYIGILLT